MNLWIFLNDKPLKTLQPAGLLALRLWLAQEFLLAGCTKLSTGLHAPDWFASLSFPFPLALLPNDINWIIAGTSEIGLAVLLALGLFGRFAATGLLFITWVAVYSVHFDLGWHGWNQIETEHGLGYKVPLMMGIMLLQLVCVGMGKWSFDVWRTHNTSAMTH
jgi:putative oxidoreductase